MKKAQVTIFIILGIIVVALVAVALYFNSDYLKSIFSTEAGRAETVPEQLKPVKVYIENCVAEVAEDGINALGTQGGYIEIPEDILPRGIINQFSNSLEIFPGYYVPYWQYESANGIQKIQVPSKQDMQEDLNSYIEDNLDLCLEGLEDFEAEGYEIDVGAGLKAETSIQDTHVEVTITYPIEVTRNEISQEMKTHFTDVKVPLGDLYNLAKDILEEENNEYFLEEKTLDMLIIYDDLPYTGFSFNCAPQVWFKNDIERDFKEIASTNINAIKIEGSPDEYFALELGGNYPSISSSFMYSPSWPFYLSIDDDKQVLKEETLTGDKATAIISSVTCLSNFHFVYDVKYPVLITLNKEGFDFQFATMVVVDNNQPRQNLIWDENLEQGESMCEYATMPLTVYAINSETGSSISNANVVFSCVTSTCNTGTTTSNGLTANFPACINAEIRVDKQGYNSGSTTINTNSPGTVSIFLQPIHEKDLVIKVIENGRTRNLRSDETVLIQATNDFDNYDIVLTQENDKIGLIPGEYLFIAYLTRESEEGVTLRSQEIRSCVEVPKRGVLGLIGLKETQCSESTIDPVTLNNILIGGAEFIQEYSSQELKSSSQLTLYVMAQSTPQTYTDLKNIYEKLPTYHESPDFILPQLK